MNLKENEYLTVKIHLQRPPLGIVIPASRIFKLLIIFDLFVDESDDVRLYVFVYIGNGQNLSIRFSLKFKFSVCSLFYSLENFVSTNNIVGQHIIFTDKIISFTRPLTTILNILSAIDLPLPLSIELEEEREARGEKAEVAREEVEQEEEEEGLLTLGL